MSSTLIWVIVFIVGLGTFLMRASFVMFLHDKQQSPLFAQALRYVAPAMLSTIVVANLIDHGYTVASGGLQRLVAAAIAGVVAWFSKSLFWTIISGMVALWLLNLALG